MLGYHVFIIYKDKEGKKRDVFFFNYSKEEVQETFSVPYMKNKAILIEGNFVHTSNIEKIEIYGSKEPFEKLILPNGKSCVDSSVTSAYIAKCFDLRKVGNVGLCTHNFIISPPKKR